jgi:hypothetical protein
VSNAHAAPRPAIGLEIGGVPPTRLQNIRALWNFPQPRHSSEQPEPKDIDSRIRRSVTLR